MVTKTNQPKLGIIAGSGILPVQLIRFCQRTQRPFFVIALKHHAEAKLFPSDCPIKWVRMGAAGKAYRLLKQNDVKEIVMIGGVRRPSVWEVLPDLFGIRLLMRIGLSKKGDDGLLRDIVCEVEKLGFRIRGVHELMPELLAPGGIWTTCQPTRQNKTDIERGCYTAKLLGLADVGQSVVVQNGLVLAVEGIEGTQKLLERSSQLRRKGRGGVLVKMMKPQQEARADMPTIGVKTVEEIVQSGLDGIAVEAEKVLVADIDNVIRTANKAGVFIVGIRAGEILSDTVLSAMQQISKETGTIRRNDK